MIDLPKGFYFYSSVLLPPGLTIQEVAGEYAIFLHQVHRDFAVMTEFEPQQRKVNIYCSHSENGKLAYDTILNQVRSVEERKTRSNPQPTSRSWNKEKVSREITQREHETLQKRKIREQRHNEFLRHPRQNEAIYHCNFTFNPLVDVMYYYGKNLKSISWLVERFDCWIWLKDENLCVATHDLNAFIDVTWSIKGTRSLIDGISSAPSKMVLIHQLKDHDTFQLAQTTDYPLLPKRNRMIRMAKLVRNGFENVSTSFLDRQIELMTHKLKEGLSLAQWNSGPVKLKICLGNLCMTKFPTYNIWPFEDFNEITNSANFKSEFTKKVQIQEPRLKLALNKLLKLEAQSNDPNVRSVVITCVNRTTSIDSPNFTIRLKRNRDNSLYNPEISLRDCPLVEVDFCLPEFKLDLQVSVTASLNLSDPTLNEWAKEFSYTNDGVFKFKNSDQYQVISVTEVTDTLVHYCGHRLECCRFASWKFPRIADWTPLLSDKLYVIDEVAHNKGVKIEIFRNSIFDALTESMQARFGRPASWDPEALINPALIKDMFQNSRSIAQHLDPFLDPIRFNQMEPFLETASKRTSEGPSTYGK